MIHWDMQTVKHFGKNPTSAQAKRCVWVTCDRCGYGRWSIIGQAVKAKTNLCKQCHCATRQMPDNKGRRHGMWCGGRIGHSDGYVYIHVETLAAKEQALYGNMADQNGYILEHRLVAARKLGRSLTQNEIAHHENGKRDDNRPENISVIASPGEHIRLHAQLRAASV